MTHVPLILQPVQFRSVTAKNRIVVSPMCQYSAVDGLGQDWHVQNLGAKAFGGPGIVFTEATHVSPDARITNGCLGLWNDAHEAFLTRLAGMIAQTGAVPAMQIAHAGRKASSWEPWLGDGFNAPGVNGGWLPVAPSALPGTPDRPTPHALAVSEIAAITANFAASAARALRAGFKIIEIHAAHGYLLHSFLSPVSNQRTDSYGGSLQHRARLLMEVIDAVRSEWPTDLPLFVRLSCVDWIEGGLTIEDSVQIGQWLKARGDVDLIDCSSGGASPAQKITSIHPGYQVPFAEALRHQAGIATGAVGMIRTADHAAEIIANGRADLVFVARALLADPGWPRRIAAELGHPLIDPPQYLRATPA
jgi:2,4-dienoyl-CoA reductase-like NADH-dependent reductase (Old Yellow Enzyme family)